MRVQYMVKRIVDTLILKERYTHVRVKDEGRLPEKGRVEVLLAKDKPCLVCMECKCPVTTGAVDVGDDTSPAVVQTLWELCQLVIEYKKTCYAVLTTMDCWRFFSLDVAGLKTMGVKAGHVLQWRKIDAHNDNLKDKWADYEDSRDLRATWAYQVAGVDTKEILETLNWVVDAVNN
eukprot:TRINITY_DN66629_c1_g9_i1.p2 TRINITY_DN66629_c1_g9~~TRINITY_DN66629_c1_g9_i1.p2  ORF type:complete len:176 (-),score=21.86 TRINITY_DN66629_c1_g9_i1:210-737(-)